MGCTFDSGYGAFLFEGKHWTIHRLSYFFQYGFVPPQLNHKCNEPLCCNPQHLYAGTQLENMKDRKMNGGWRGDIGEKCWNAKLTHAAVRAIRESTETNKELARKFGVNASQISRARAGVRWKGVI